MFFYFMEDKFILERHTEHTKNKKIHTIVCFHIEYLFAQQLTTLYFNIFAIK